MTKDTRDNAVDLLPCPFCGGKASFQTAFPDTPLCISCGAAAASVEAWNTRATPPLETIIARIELKRKATGTISEDIHDKNTIYNQALNEAISIIREEGK